MNDPRPVWLGRVAYGDALVAQRARREAVIARTAPEALWLLEHDPVITTGLRGAADVPPAEALAADGIALFHVERGGLATWHGPGQLVGYLIVDLATRNFRVKDVIAGVEDGVIAWLAGEGIAAGRRDGFPGVWCGRDKICAVGMHFRRGVSMHGFALNLEPDLGGFARIVPCGITDGGVTTFARQSGRSMSPAAASAGVGAAVWAAIVDRHAGRVKVAGTAGM